jgi:hypothetical protein
MNSPSLSSIADVLDDAVKYVRSRGLTAQNAIVMAATDSGEDDDLVDEELIDAALAEYLTVAPDAEFRVMPKQTVAAGLRDAACAVRRRAENTGACDAGF